MLWDWWSCFGWSTSCSCLWRNRSIVSDGIAWLRLWHNTYRWKLSTLSWVWRQSGRSRTSTSKWAVFNSQHIKKCNAHESEKRMSNTPCKEWRQFLAWMQGPDQNLKWSTIKQEYQQLKNLDLRDTDTGPVELIIELTTLTWFYQKKFWKPQVNRNLTGHLMLFRPHLDGRWLIGYLVSEELYLHTMGWRCMEEVQLKMRSWSSWSWLSQR